MTSPSDLLTKALWSALLVICWLAVRDLVRAARRWLRERRCPNCGEIHTGDKARCDICIALDSLSEAEWRRLVQGGWE